MSNLEQASACSRNHASHRDEKVIVTGEGRGGKQKSTIKKLAHLFFDRQCCPFSLGPSIM